MRSEGEVHVQAMRLVCEALEDREENGLEVDWDVINQQLDHMDVILQGITDQRRDDAEEIERLRRERDAAYERVSTVRDEVGAEIEAVRKLLADAQRSASDEFTERQVLTAEQQQDAAAWQQQVDVAQAEVQYLRERLDEERSVSARFLRKLTAAEAAASLQRSGIERLNKFVGKVRNAQNNYQWPASWNEITAALAELDAGNSEPEGGQ